MKKSFLAVASAAVLALAVSAEPAQAAPVFELPDVNFAATASGRTASLPFTNAPILFASEGLLMSVLSSSGDQISENSGHGFVPQSSWAVQLFNGTGTATSTGFKFSNIDLYFGATSGTGSAESFASNTLTLTKDSIGYLGFGTFTITSSGLAGFHVGQTVGVDLLLTNVGSFSLDGFTVYTADVKGDVAPIVPEPTSLGLLAFGLVGLVVRRRRR